MTAINSEDMKTEVLAWLRYMRRCEIVCTEAGNYSADVWGLTPERLIEVETKISISDLKADFRKDKHQLYQKFAADEQARRVGMPNSFYFCVPEDLVEKTQAYLEAHELPIVKKYGIISIPVGARRLLGRNAAVVKKASKIHDTPPHAVTREAALMRASSELCGTKEALKLHRQRLEGSLWELTKATVALYSREEPQAIPALEE